MLRLLCLTLCLLAFPVAAEPALADLKAALGKRAGTEPVSGELKVTVRHQLGKGDHSDLREGQAQITVRADSTGLHWGYSPEALAQKQRERQKTVLDPSAATPLLTAQAELDLPAVARHVSAVEHLQHWVALSEYLGHTSTQYLDQPARILTFHYGIERLSHRETRYVKNYQGELKIWIDQHGTPLRSEVVTRMSGRAFIFVRFSSNTDESREYHILGDRLITSYSRYHAEASGAGEYSMSEVEYWFFPSGEVQ